VSIGTKLVSTPLNAATLASSLYFVNGIVLQELSLTLPIPDSLIWSHAHWDHVGDASLFPTSSEIVVGPGFTDAFLPPFPENPNARHDAAFFKDRQLREVKFDSGVKLGEFEAHDFFGDGSFYLLDAPGHCIGHMCGFARTTPDTFVLMGGDICHFAGYIRPSKMSPLPDPVTSVTPLDSYFPSPCPCSIFEDVQHANDKNYERTQPFYSITRNEHSSYADREQAVEDQRKLLAFDASPDVLVCLAHDPTMLKVLPVLNDSASEDINDWKAQGWKAQCQWGFLNELPRDGKRGRKLLVEGIWKDGKLYNIEG
jgi:hypothetical protein